jgi:hypothetical protein
MIVRGPGRGWEHRSGEQKLVKLLSPKSSAIHALGLGFAGGDGVGGTKLYCEYGIRRRYISWGKYLYSLLRFLSALFFVIVTVETAQFKGDEHVGQSLDFGGAGFGLGVQAVLGFYP